MKEWMRKVASLLLIAAMLLSNGGPINLAETMEEILTATAGFTVEQTMEAIEETTPEPETSSIEEPEATLSLEAEETVPSESVEPSTEVSTEASPAPSDAPEEEATEQFEVEPTEEGEELPTHEQTEANDAPETEQESIGREDAAQSEEMADSDEGATPEVTYTINVPDEILADFDMEA